MAASYQVTNTTKGNSIKSTMDEKGYVISTTQQTFDILLSDNNDLDTTVSVRINAPLPRFNDPHPDSLRLRVDDISITQETVLLYKAVVSYSSPKAPSDDEETPPTELPVEITWASVTTQAETTVDYDGNAIVNDGTGEAIFGVTRDVSDLQGTFTKNFLTFNPSSIYLFNNKVNSDTFVGFPAGTARITNISATNEIKDDIPFWKVTVVISFRAPYATTDDKAWYVRTLRQGYRVKVGSQIVDAVDSFKQRVTTPVRLSSTGTQLAVGDASEFKEIKVYGSTSFSALGLL